ncbi:MAG: ABC transporter ATP-binding protein [Sphingobacteriales bacterium]|nr:MAG: ABC transporter ATP-binding protein [Sphingobacteriales bacterium]
MSFDYKVTGRAFDSGLLRRVLGLISGYKGIFFLSLVLTIAMALLGPSVPLMVQKTIDKEIMHGDHAGLLNKCLIIIGLLLAQTLVMYFQTFYTSWLGQQAIANLRTRIFDHILHFRLKVYDKTAVGTMITRTVSDVETVADVFAEGLINIMGDLLQIIVILTIMFYTDWQLSVASLAVFPFLLLAAYIFKEKVKISFQDVRTQVGRLNAFLQEHITGMQIVQVFNREDKEEEKFRQINANHRDANIRGVMAYAVFFPVIEVLSSISIALIIWWGAKGIISASVTPGVLLMFIMFINLLFRPIRQVADKFNTLQMGMVAADRIFKVLDMTDNIPDKGENAPDVLPGKVEFKNVWFSYDDENPEQNWILKDVSFTVEPGKMLAIVGHTGAGKSSITNLINRLYTYQKGAVCIDNIPIENYKLSWLRKQIAVVLQDVFLFSDTISNNIKLYNETISREQMMEAAKLVGAQRFIERLPQNYDYEVQERGATLSTGQRQLISFIRAIIQDPKILILDEATSSIDHETEEMIQHATEVLLKDRTSIVIAHRLATIQNADQIIVLDKGIIAERGTHQELLAQNGLYKKLYELQFTELVI